MKKEERELNLNFEVVSELAEKLCIDNDFLQELVSCENAVTKSIQDNVGGKFGIWEHLSGILDGFSVHLGEEFLKKKHHPYEIVNLGYFLPSIFEKVLKKGLVNFSTLTNSQITTILSSKSCAEIIAKFCMAGGVIKDERLLLQLLFALKKNVFFKNKENEAEFIENILSLSLFSDTTTILLNMRLASLIRRNNKTEKDPSKIALIVGGQFRGTGSNLSKLQEVLGDFKVDVFVSTWEKKGGESIKPVQVSRHFDSDSVAYFKTIDFSEVESIVHRVISYRKKMLGNVVVQDVTNFFNWADNVVVNIEDESQKLFSSMSNEEKMYFHNAYWISKFGKEYFLEYDLIIKIRPDIEFLAFESSAIKEFFRKNEDNQIVTEDHEGWIFRRWGFGVGDQVLIGRPGSMINLLNLYNEPYLTDIVNKRIIEKNAFKGHVNLGMAAYFLGYECHGNEFFKIKFSELPKIRFGQLDGI